ncbi:uncharacterized protein N7483_008872 [Penicillium malachiteum]|uniref:uncharacterized protein n=1 Tax=Penicillium malachiteum TaxID=1324776 RepID=UPI002548EF55|nr:uncharacterized protein N7483_008872 [Penicillium malachiteum]KAJ5720938.1 hypothetical protein N7483_008872 [Penicillium malachiteum]
MHWLFFVLYDRFAQFLQILPSWILDGQAPGVPKKWAIWTPRLILKRNLHTSSTRDPTQKGKDVL